MNIHYIVLVLATWRISNLVANEGGPFHVFRRFRLYCLFSCQCNPILRKFHLYELVQCEYCNSVWFGTGIIVLYYALGPILIWLLAPLALSATVIFLKVIKERIER